MKEILNHIQCFFSGILLKKTLQKFLQHLFEDNLINQKIKTESLITVSPVDFNAANFLFKVQNLQQDSFSVDTLFKFVQYMHFIFDWYEIHYLDRVFKRSGIKLCRFSRLLLFAYRILRNSAMFW